MPGGMVSVGSRAVVDSRVASFVSVCPGLNVLNDEVALSQVNCSIAAAGSRCTVYIVVAT